jgi:hypothetical protein
LDYDIILNYTKNQIKEININNIAGPLKNTKEVKEKIFLNNIKSINLAKERCTLYAQINVEFKNIYLESQNKFIINYKNNIEKVLYL